VKRKPENIKNKGRSHKREQKWLKAPEKPRGGQFAVFIKRKS